MSLKKIFIGIALTMLIAFAMISFGHQLTEDNYSNASILNDPVISKMNSSIQTNLSSYQSVVQSQRESVEDEGKDIKSGFGTLVIFSIIAAGRIFTGMVVGGFGIIMGLFSDSRIGVPPMFIGVFTAIMIVSLVLAGWRLYKAGE